MQQKFDNAIKELRDSIAQGGEEFRSDGAVILDSLKEIAEDAGIDMKENEAISDAYHAVKESFEQGIDDFKSDLTIAKESMEEIAADRNEAKAEKKAEKREKFDEKVDELKKALE